MPLLEALFRRSVRDRNRAAMVERLLTMEREKAAADVVRERRRAIVMTGETPCAGCGISLGKPGGPLRPFAAVPRHDDGVDGDHSAAATRRSRRHGSFRIMDPDDDDDDDRDGAHYYDVLCYKCHLSQEQSAGLFDDEEDVDVEGEAVGQEMDEEAMERTSGKMVKGKKRELMMRDEGGLADRADQVFPPPMTTTTTHPQPIIALGGLMELEGLFDDDEDDFEL